MVSIKLQGIKANAALELVAELKTSGLLLNTDFEWSFHREQMHHDLGGSFIEPRFCEFRFRDPKLATFYSLKWNTLMN